MAKVTITNPTPHKRVTRGKNGKGGKPREVKAWTHSRMTSPPSP